MPRTSGTRRGNGPGKGPAGGIGWGGAAKGEGGPPGGPGTGRPKGVKDGEGKKARARAALEEAAPLAVQTVIDLAKDKADPRALAAAFGILNRVGLHEKAGVEHSGEVGFTVVSGVERDED